APGDGLDGAGRRRDEGGGRRGRGRREEGASVHAADCSRGQVSIVPLVGSGFENGGVGSGLERDVYGVRSRLPKLAILATMSQGQVVGAALAALLAAVSVAATPGATVQTRVPSEPPAIRRPNVLIFLVDDLGQRDIAAYGSTFHETPHTVRLAREGLRFDAAYASAPVCSPTRASLMTGLWPQRTGITDYIGAPATPDAWTRNTRVLPAPFADRLALDALTIAEHARAHGYATFFAGKWHLGPEGWWPEDQGFDVNMGGIDRGGPYGGKRYFSPYDNPRLPDGPDGEHLPHRLAVETARFIETRRDAPFLAVLSFYSVHTPLLARPDLEREFDAKRRRLGLEARWGREGERDVRLVQEHAAYAEIG